MSKVEPSEKKRPNLKTRTGRAALPVQHSLHSHPLERGRALCYRKGEKGGMWIARFYDPEGNPPMVFKSLGAADDVSEADGKMVLSFEQAKAAAEVWFREAYHHATGERVHTGVYTVAMAVDAYIEDRIRHGAKTAPRMRKDFGARVIPALGNLDLARLNRKQLEDWMLAEASSPVRRRGVVQAPPQGEDEHRARRESINRMWKNLKAALNLALKDKRVATDAGWRDVKAFRGTKKARTRFLTLDEQQRLVNAAPAEDFRALIKAGLFTGAREGELLRLTAQDFAGDRGTVWIAPGKTGRGRYTHLTEEGAAFFRELTAGKASTDRLFPRTCYDRKYKRCNGEWSRAELSRMMRAACEAAMIEPLVFHELRHTAVSLWINGGMSLWAAASQVGHHNQRMIQEHYGHLDPDAVAAAVRRIGPQGIHTPGPVMPLEIKRA